MRDSKSIDDRKDTIVREDKAEQFIRDKYPRQAERFLHEKPVIVWNDSKARWMVVINPQTNLRCFGCTYNGNMVQRHFRGSGYGHIACDSVNAFNNDIFHK